MGKFNWKMELTPKGDKTITADFSAELVSVAKDKLTNVNGVGYYPATISFINEKDETVKRSGLIYESNFSHGMSVGTTYLAKVIKAEGKLPLIVVSHLDRAGSVSDDDFGLSNDMFLDANFDKVAK
jgi:hypothetical protein